MDEKVRFYKSHEDYVKCELCPHNCLLSENKFGVCALRTVKNNVPGNKR